MGGAHAQRFDLVGVFAHPDDEAYAAGGLMCLCADAGARVAAVCATAGEGGGSATVRRQELERACRVIGAQPFVLGWPDGGLDDEGARDRRIDELEAWLSGSNARTVITLGSDGAYGHRDHLALTAMVAAATAERARRGKTRVLHAQFEPHVFRPVWRQMRRWSENPLAPHLTESDIGTAASQVDLRIDIAAAADRKRAAIESHRSQGPGALAFSVFRPDLVHAVCERELYTVSAGPIVTSQTAAGVLR